MNLFSRQYRQWTKDTDSGHKTILAETGSHSSVTANKDTQELFHRKSLMTSTGNHLTIVAEITGVSSDNVGKQTTRP